MGREGPPAGTLEQELKGKERNHLGICRKNVPERCKHKCRDWMLLGRFQEQEGGPAARSHGESG